MNESRQYSLFDIKDRLEQTNGGKPVAMQALYNARRQARENARKFWKVKEVDTLVPTRYDTEHALGILDELTTMTWMNTTPHDMLYIKKSGLTEDTIAKAEEAIVFDTSPKIEPEGLELSQISPEEASEEPFRIRGHHLFHYADLINRFGGYAPGKAKLLTESMAQQLKRVRNSPFRYHDRAQWYYEDVVGPEQEDTDLYQEKIEASFKEFSSLPDNAPIDLVAGSKDEMCKGCSIGEHCTLRSYALRPDGMVEHDQHFISAFVNETWRFGQAADLRVFKRTTEFSNAPDEEIEGIRVSAGTVRSVLANSDVEWAGLTKRLRV